jgi:hypothetical protein
VTAIVHVHVVGLPLLSSTCQGPEYKDKLTDPASSS